MYGVSPAFFLSSFGPGFRPWDIVRALTSLRDLGYQSFQPEAFQSVAAESWTERDSREIADRARSLGLVTGPFVAHWLGAAFSNPEDVARPGLPAGTERALGIAAALEGAPVFAVPLPALDLSRFGASSSSGNASIGPARAGLKGALIDKLGLLAEAARSSGFRAALELLPGNALGGSAEFRSLLSTRGLEDLGLVLDTGHFHVMGEDVPALPARLAGAVVATHLCDNDGIENLSLAPGAGTIPFRPLLAALAASGYRGGLDVEILCPPGEVSREYGRALTALRTLEQAGPFPAGPDTEIENDRPPETSCGTITRGLERSPA